MNAKTLHAILKLSGLECTSCHVPMQIMDVRQIDEDLYLLRVIDTCQKTYALYSVSKRSMNCGGTFCFEEMSADWRPWEEVMKEVAQSRYCFENITKNKIK